MEKSDTIEYTAEYAEGDGLELTGAKVLVYKFDSSHIRTIEDVKKVLMDFNITLCIHEGEDPPGPKYWKKD